MPKSSPQLTVSIVEEQPLPLAAVRVTAHLQSVFARHRPAQLSSALVEILVTDDARMQELNHTHRGVNATTDVLSFPTAIDDTHGQVVPSAEGTLHLGLIAISLPQATRQVGRFGDTLDDELLGLAEHGLRHLLGHDHDDQGVWH